MFSFLVSLSCTVKHCVLKIDFLLQDEARDLADISTNSCQGSQIVTGGVTVPLSDSLKPSLALVIKGITYSLSHHLLVKIYLHDKINKTVNNLKEHNKRLSAKVGLWLV